MRGFYKILFLLLFYHSTGTQLLAQNDFKSEEDLKKNAEELFEETEFAKAMPLYSQLLSLHPKDANFNFRFGVCLLSAGSDKEKPLKYLEFAVKKPEVEKEAFFWLGRAYHLNYRFSDAINAYTKFKSIASSKSLKKLDVDRQLEMCKNGTTLLKNISDLVVIQKKELKSEEAFRAYDFTNIGGKLLVMPDEFKTLLDKKKKNESTIFFSQRTEELYFASFGKEDKTGKDIYKVKKLPNGSWSEPMNMGNIINTPYDEDYPYLHPDGKTFYFCSKGHNSMGGYDVFRSVFNGETGTWGTPVNVDFAISTPDDDFLYVTDSTNTFAYFSSKRASADGYTTIYKLKIDRIPVEIALIKGKYSSQTNSSSKAAKITVQNVDNGELVGVFSTNNNGDYLINLPNGGKFLFVVEPEQGKSQSELVVLPVQYELNPLRQEITQQSPSQIKISNYFDEVALDQNSYMAALEFIKQRANLEVNYSAEAEEKDKKTKAIAAETGSKANSNTANNTDKTANLSNTELVNNAFKTAEESKKEAAELKKNSDHAYSISSQKNELSIKKAKEAEQIFAKAEAISDPTKKQEEINKATKLKNESQVLAREAVIAYNLAKDIENQSSDKQKEAEQNQQYAEQLDKAVKSNSIESIAQLTQQKSEPQQQVNTESNLIASIRAEADAKKAEAERASKKAASLKSDITDIESERKNLKAEAEKTKDKQLKEALDMQVTELDQELEEKKKSQQKWQDQAIALAKESDEIDQDVSIANNLLSEIKSGSNTSVASVDKAKLGTQIAQYKTSGSSSYAYQSKGTGNSTNVSSSNKSGDFDSNGTVTYSEKQASGPASNTSGSDISASSKEQDELAASEISDINFSFEKEIKSLEADTDAGKREAAQSKIYYNWSNALNAEAAKRKSGLNSITDDQKKKKEQELITQIENQAREKQKLADNYSSASSTALANDSKKSTEEELFVSSDYKERSSKFELEAKNLEQLQDSVEKAEQKSKLYNNWITSISNEISLLKEREQKSSNSEEKAKIIGQISQLEAERSEKESAAAQSYAIVERYKKEQSQTSTTSTEVAAVNERFEKDLASVESNPNEIDRETAKAETYKNWSEAIDNEINTIRNAATASGNSLSDKDNFKISQLEAASNEKKELAAQSIAKVDQIKQGSLASGPNESTSNSRSDKVAEREKAKNENVNDLSSTRNISTENGELMVSQGTTAAFNNLNLIQEQENIKYTDSNFTADAEAAKLSLAESEILITRADSIRKEAYKIENTNDRTASLSQASFLDEKANQKKIEGYLKLLNLNRKQYNENIVIVKEFEEVSKSQGSGDATAAFILSGESEEFNSEATALKSVISTAENNTLKISSLQRAYESQTKALDRQQKAIALYSNANPGYIVTGKYKEPNTSTSSRPVADEFTIEDSKEAAFKDTGNPETTRVREDASASSGTETGNVTTDMESSSSAEFVKTESDNISNNIPVVLNKAADESNTGSEFDQSVTLAKNNSAKENGVINPEMIDKSSYLSEENELKREVFEAFARSNYSKENPIPINEKLPVGLIFKVQIGAFRNPVSPEQFKGFAPLMGETTSSGIIRYTAGMFKSFETASTAKNQIKDLGFKDAFVVAFCNGNRISTSEALSMIKEGRNCPVTAVASSSTRETSSSVSFPSSVPVSVSETAGSVPGSDSDPTTVLKDVKVDKVKGLFYTVQVGVFSGNVAASRLKNIHPLYSEQTTKGLIRYSTGIFDNINDARTARQQIISLGITDAFITAYNNGKRISIEDSKKIIEQEGNSAFAKSENMNKMPLTKGVAIPARTESLPTKTSQSIPPVENKVNKTNLTTSSNEPVVVSGTAFNGSKSVVDTSVVFKVQIGAFKNEMPVEIAALYLKIAQKGITHYLTSEGITIYSVGALSNYLEATKLKDEVVQQGLKDAFVVAYKNGEKINLEAFLNK